MARKVSPTVIVGLMLVACASMFPSSPGPATPWPTLAPLGESATGQVIGVESQPRLVKRFRADIISGVMSAYPLPGRADLPIRVEVVVLSGNLDPRIEINSAAGDPLADVNLAGEGAPEVIGEFQFPVDSVYELALGAASGAGQVGVSIYQLAGPDTAGTAATMSPAKTQVGVLRQPASFQSYHMPLESGSRVDIQVTAATPDLSLRLALFDPDGENTRATVDTSGPNPAIWNFLPSKTGAYTIMVSNRDEGMGEYSLTTAPSTSGGRAVIGSRAVLELGSMPRKSLWLTMDGIALDGVTVEARPVDANLDLAVAVSDPYGHLLTRVNSVGAGAKETLDLVQFPFSGPHQIEFSAVGGSGEFQYYIRPVRLVDAKIGGKIYPAGRAEHGEFYGPGSVIVYNFQAEAGDLIGVDAHATAGSGLDLGFDLFDPDGEKLLTRDDDVGKDPVLDRIALPKSGSYMLALWNYADSTGPYEIYVTTPEAPSSTPD